MSKIIECLKCSRVVSITPENKSTEMDAEGKKRQLNAGHGMVLGSDLTCACGKVL